MEFAIFIRLSEFLIQTPDAMMNATIIGMVTLPLLVLWMPIRATKAVNRYRQYRAMDVPEKPRKTGYAFAFVLLALAFYATLELVVLFTTAKGGEVSVVMLPMLSVVPFAFYIGFEIALPAASKPGL